MQPDWLLLANYYIIPEGTPTAVYAVMAPSSLASARYTVINIDPTSKSAALKQAGAQGNAAGIIRQPQHREHCQLRCNNSVDDSGSYSDRWYLIHCLALAGHVSTAMFYGVISMDHFLLMLSRVDEQTNKQASVHACIREYVPRAGS